jgi:hypothetical protein
MKKNIMKKFFEVTLILLLFLGCISSESESATPSATSPPTTVSSASFEVTDLRVIPANPTVGDTVTILVDVQNTGDAAGSHTLLVIIGSTSQTQSMELEGKSSKTVELEAIMDTAGSTEISTGNITKTITVGGEETPAPTTQAPTTAPTTPAPSTPAPTTSAPPTPAPKDNKLERPAYELGTRLNYLFTVGGNEWGSTVSYNSPYEEERTPWFQWGMTDWWNDNPNDTYWRGDYHYFYDRNWDLKGVLAARIGGTEVFNQYIRLYDKDVDVLPDDWPACTGKYNDPLPTIYPLVKGAEKIDTGKFCLVTFGSSFYTGTKVPEGRGTYERRIYVEDFEEIEAGGETYRCAKVQYFMRHTVEFLSPHANEEWSRMEWIEEGYRWYSEIGLVRAEFTVKTYWWDELEKTDRVLIELTGATLP